MSAISAMDPLSDNQRLALQFLQDIYEVSAELATRTYIWGGMAPDILCGAFLRDHHDVDGFVLNLLDVKDDLAARFAARGYTTTYLDEVDLLRIDQGGLRAAFNRLEIEGNLAMWRHVGDHGTVTFPANWLDPAPRRFYGVCTHISGVQFEVAIKTHVRLLSPEWHPRDKDRAALAFLRAELAGNGLDEAQVLSEIWSHTPYWAAKGYPEYANPIVPGLGSKVDKDRELYPPNP